MIADEQQLLREQEERAEKEQLHFSGRIWHEVLPKVRPSLFIKALRPQIDLRDYGEGLAKFYFTFVVLEKLTPNFANWVGSDYYPKKASVDIGVRVPYQKVVEGDEHDVIKLMEQAVLDGIDTLAEHEEQFIAPFDYQVFKADVAAIFAQENWYETEDTPA